MFKFLPKLTLNISDSNLQLNNTGTLAADVKISGLGGKIFEPDQGDI